MSGKAFNFYSTNKRDSYFSIKNITDIPEVIDECKDAIIELDTEGSANSVTPKNNYKLHKKVPRKTTLG